jgi:hypothetical protein
LGEVKKAIRRFLEIGLARLREKWFWSGSPLCAAPLRQGGPHFAPFAYFRNYSEKKLRKTHSLNE